MAISCFKTKAEIKRRLLEVLDSIDERVKESEEILFFFPNEEYHEGRKEALEVTRQQILCLFAEVLI